MAEFTPERFVKRLRPVPPEDWLGPESHVPGLGRELRGQDRSTGRWSLRWAVFSIFVAGFALGSVITQLVTPRRSLR